MTGLKTILKHHWAAIVTSLLCALCFVLTSLPLWTVLLVVVLSMVWIGSVHRNMETTKKNLENKIRNESRHTEQVFNELQSTIAMLENDGLQETHANVVQLQDLIKNAVQQLNTSFNGLNGNTADQGNILLALVEKISSTNFQSDNNADESQSLKEFASEMSNIIEFFISQVLETSQESMTMVHMIDDIVKQMSEVDKLVADVRTIADQTNLLALNAAIEAARAGEAGRGFAVVADEVRKLSQHSNSFSDQISGVVGTALGNIEKAKDIVGQMASKDMSLVIKSKARVDGILEEISSLNEFLTDKLNNASSITESIAQNVNLAVVSLQFEDMATQLADHIDKRFELYAKMAVKVCETYAGVISNNEEDQDINGRIEELKNDLNAIKKDLDASIVKVNSNSAQLAQSDVDLF